MKFTEKIEKELTDKYNRLVKDEYECTATGFKNLIDEYEFDTLDIYPIL
jgi:hypothetical protein